jgi:outer membrane protein assembly factor BamD
MHLLTEMKSGRSVGVRRMTAMVGVFALSLALLPADAATKPPKKKKNTDLSANPLANVASKQPDKELFDKAMIAMKKGRFDVSRLDLQTMLNTYPNSEYLMRAKLAVGDSWFKEGGTAALAQAESEYEDFITFFPNVPEAAEAKMKVGDIFYMQMEKPDRDFANAQKAEQKYREMVQQYPDSTLVPKAKQKLREVQEVLAEREFLIGQYYAGKMNYAGSIARLQTVADSYPLYSKSDDLWIQIGDDYAGQAHAIQLARQLPGAVRERLAQVFQDKAAAAYDKVITRYPMAPHVEDARDRLVAMNRPVPEPTEAAVAENSAEESSQQPVRIGDKLFGMVKHGPLVGEAAHVGEPDMAPPARTTAPEVNKDDSLLFAAALKTTQPGAPAADASAAATAQPSGPNEPPRSDQPQVPLQFEPVSGAEGTGIHAGVVGSGNPGTGTPAAPATEDPNAVVKAVTSTTTTLPAAEAAAPAPAQINDIKPGATGTDAPADPNAKPTKKKPKLDQSDEASSKKKKKKGLSKLNPF